MKHLRYRLPEPKPVVRITVPDREMERGDETEHDACHDSGNQEENVFLHRLPSSGRPGAAGEERGNVRHNKSERVEDRPGDNDSL